MKIQNTTEFWDFVNKLPEGVRDFLFSEKCGELCEKLEEISGKSGDYFLQIIFDMLSGELDPNLLRHKIKKEFVDYENKVDEITTLIGRNVILRFNNYLKEIYSKNKDGEKETKEIKEEEEKQENLKDSAY